jgi:hypothetical protein
LAAALATPTSIRLRFERLVLLLTRRDDYASAGLDLLDLHRGLPLDLGVLGHLHRDVFAVLVLEHAWSAAAIVTVPMIL